MFSIGIMSDVVLSNHIMATKLFQFSGMHYRVACLNGEATAYFASSVK